MRLSFLVLLVFLFHGSHSQTVNHWESLVNANNIWKYMVGNSEPPATWIQTGFDDSSWLQGPGGVGYGDGDDGTTISSARVVYLRKNFTVANPGDIASLMLFVDYDDGFVAYLNGQEIARANVGTPGVRPPYTAYAINCDREPSLPNGGVPPRFILTAAQKGYLKQGDNVLAIQVHNCNATSSDLSSSAFLVAGMVTTATQYQSTPAWFKDPEDEKSHLPLVIIETGGKVIGNSEKVDVHMKIVDNGPGKNNGFFDPGNVYDGRVGIEIRGQSSQSFPKKSYGFETRDAQGGENKVSLLGMPEHDDWVLYAPYSDKTMLRNDLSYYLGRRMLRWQPDARFVEAYLNGEYIGVYQLVERIKRGKDRVDINKLEKDDTSGDALTGGYIFKVDKVHDLSPYEYFTSVPSYGYKNARNYQFTWYYPKSEDIQNIQKNYLAGFIVNFQNTLNSSGFTHASNGYSKMIDVQSFIDFQIVNELSNNIDGYRYSTYFYKERDSKGGKMVAGPLWDFDLGYGNLDYSYRHEVTSFWCYENYGPGEPNCMHWWARLMEDPVYATKVKTRYSQLRQGVLHTDSVFSYIERQVAHLGPAVARNFDRWKIMGTYVWPNRFVGQSHGAEVSELKNWISRRLAWMDTQWLIDLTGIDQDEKGDQVLVYPNPVADKLIYTLPDSGLSDCVIEVFTLQGTKIWSEQRMVQGGDEDQIQVSHLPAGIYMLRISGPDMKPVSRKWVKR